MSQIQRKHLTIALVAVLVVVLALAGSSLMAVDNTAAKGCCAAQADAACCADGCGECCADGCANCAGCADGCKNCEGCTADVCCADGCENCAGCADGCDKCEGCAKTDCCKSTAAKGEGDKCCKKDKSK